MADPFMSVLADLNGVALAAATTASGALAPVNVERWFAFSVLAGFIVGVAGMFRRMAKTEETPLTAVFGWVAGLLMIVGLMGGVMAFVGWWLAFGLVAHYSAWPASALFSWALPTLWGGGGGFAAGFAVGFLLRVLSSRYFVPWMNRIFDQTLTRRVEREEGATDIREVIDKLPSPVSYRPAKFWRADSVFIGLDAGGAPVRVPLDVWRASHIEVIGPTGTGKGVASCQMLAQCLYHGGGVVVLDPKRDEWAPSVLHMAAAHYKRSARYLDLSKAVPQLDPLAGASAEEIGDLFVAGFGLAERGTDADFYRLADRKAAKFSARLAAAESLTLPELWARLDKEASHLFKDAPKFMADLEEVATLPQVATRDDGGIAALLEEGGLLYIVGTMRSAAISKLQKMLLIRVMQHLEARDRTRELRHVSIFLDELKYLLSHAALQALGTVRDKRANLVLAHQSRGDLRDVSQDLDPDAVQGGVENNTAIKLAYRALDPDTAEWMAKQSGKIKIHQERRELERTEGLAEVTTTKRTLTESERYWIDENMALRLPQRCALVLQPGQLAGLALTAPIPVEKREFEPVAAAPLTRAVPHEVETDESPAPESAPPAPSPVKPEAPAATPQVVDLSAPPPGAGAPGAPNVSNDLLEGF